jgi:hypothetical protein
MGFLDRIGPRSCLVIGAMFVGSLFHGSNYLLSRYFTPEVEIERIPERDYTPPSLRERVLPMPEDLEKREGEPWFEYECC